MDNWENGNNMNRRNKPEGKGKCYEKIKFLIEHFEPKLQVRSNNWKYRSGV